MRRHGRTGGRPTGGWTGRDERGLGLVEIALVLVVVAIAGAALYAYLGSTARTLESVREQRPLSHARLTADRATLVAIRSALQVYYGQNGQWPPDKAAVTALLAPPPSFQCTGNDYEYDPAAGQVRLLFEDPARC